MSVLGRLLATWQNPFNETRVHLAPLVRKRGFEIGAHSYGRPKVRFSGHGARLTIGKFCSIADRVEIFLGGNHRVDFVSTFPFGAFPKRWPLAARGHAAYSQGKGDVSIGHDVWIGSGATIMSGVTIGSGAVIAARALVTKDVPPYTIVGGNPAKPIRLRFDEATIEALLALAWWDLPDSEIAELVPLLQSDRVNELIQNLKKSN